MNTSYKFLCITVLIVQSMCASNYDLSEQNDIDKSLFFESEHETNTLNDDSSTNNEIKKQISQEEILTAKDLQCLGDLTQIRYLSNSKSKPQKQKSNEVESSSSVDEIESKINDTNAEEDVTDMGTTEQTVDLSDFQDLELD